MLELKGVNLPGHSSGENELTALQVWDLSLIADAVLFITKSLGSHTIVQYFTSFQSEPQIHDFSKEELFVARETMFSQTFKKFFMHN